MLVCQWILKNYTNLGKTSEGKKKIGANAILAASIASCKIAAIEKNISLFKYIDNSKNFQFYCLNFQMSN